MITSKAWPMASFRTSRTGRMTRNLSLLFLSRLCALYARGKVRKSNKNRGS